MIKSWLHFSKVIRGISIPKRLINVSHSSLKETKKFQKSFELNRGTLILRGAFKAKGFSKLSQPKRR